MALRPKRLLALRTAGHSLRTGKLTPRVERLPLGTKLLAWRTGKLALGTTGNRLRAKSLTLSVELWALRSELLALRTETLA